jgi:uncharacterized membrane protein YqjE
MESTTAAASSDASTLGASVQELASSVRALVADQVDLLAAEAHVALQSVVACIIAAVAAAVFVVLAIAGLFGLVAVKLVDSGMSWAAALGCMSVACLAVCALLLLALKGLANRKLFIATRRQLRGDG